MAGVVTVAIVVAAAAGSAGFVANNIYSSRHGFDQPSFRRLRNLGVAVVWPLVILRAFI